jgi:hypothetical protein
MPTDKPRLNVVLERPLYQTVKKLAAKEGTSLSLKARDLIREALELYEEGYWLRRAKERDKTFVRAKALTHDEVWK